jgi:hypothetical protein
MVEIQSPQVESEENLTDEEAIFKIAAAMKDNAPATEDKVNVHTFLLDVVKADNITKVSKIGNLRDDKEINELGKPVWNARGSLGMALVADKIMENKYFKEYFEADAGITFNTSLSRDGFLVRQATVSTKNVADVTRRKKYNTGMFKKGLAESSGGDPYSRQGGNE